MTTDVTAAPLERSSLKRILVHLADHDPDDRVLKTYLDSWFAHSRGGAMLEKSGRPQWMNRGDLKKEPSRCDEAHAISLAAAAAIARGDVGDLVREHTIPKAVIVAELKQRRWKSVDQLQAFLRLWYTVTIVLHMEHRSIPLVSKMPSQCTDEILVDDPGARFARYKHASSPVPIRLLPLAFETWPRLKAGDSLD